MSLQQALLFLFSSFYTLNDVLLIVVVVVGGTILAYPCAFKRGVFREVFYLAHVLSKKVCSERCVQRGVFREP